LKNSQSGEKGRGGEGATAELITKSAVKKGGGKQDIKSREVLGKRGGRLPSVPGGIGGHAPNPDPHHKTHKEERKKKKKTDKGETPGRKSPTKIVKKKPSGWEKREKKLG